MEERKDQQQNPPGKKPGDEQNQAGKQENPDQASNSGQPQDEGEKTVGKLRDPQAEDSERKRDQS